MSKASSDAGTGGVLHALGDPMRWQIVRLLAAEQLCSTHLQELLGAKQTLVSHHMRVLRDAGLVSTSPCGRFTYYRLVVEALEPFASAVAELVDAARATPPRRPC